MIKSRPTRIVSLSPTATEDLFAVGAGKQVIAVDSDSDYPKGVPTTSLVPIVRLLNYVRSAKSAADGR